MSGGKQQRGLVEALAAPAKAVLQLRCIGGDAVELGQQHQALQPRIYVRVSFARLFGLD